MSTEEQWWYSLEIAIATNNKKYAVFWTEATHCCIMFWHANTCASELCNHVHLCTTSYTS
eukprot:12658673-Prorocentrum_lima.AAC.1